MTKPEFHRDEIDWMILVYKDSGDEELKAETFEYLIGFGLDENQINERYEKIKSYKESLKAFNKAIKRQSERNEDEGYTLLEKIKIFVFGPFELFTNYQTGLKDLKDFNYKIKFRQRLILLILGIMFWFLFAYSSFQYYEHKRIKEIEEADITEWEKNRITKKEAGSATKNIIQPTDSTNDKGSNENNRKTNKH